MLPTFLSRFRSGVRDCGDGAPARGIRRGTRIAALISVLIAAPLASGPACCASIGEPAPQRPLPSIFESLDPDLQQGLKDVIAAHELGSAVASGRLAVAVADITDLDHPRVAHLNGNLMLYSASLPKIAILLGAFQRSERDDIPIDAALEADLVQMIRYSSNAAATRVLDWVGRERLIEILESPGIALYDPAHDGGLWVGKPYGPERAYRRDPLHGISHGATALQVVRFYYLLEAGRLADADDTRRMKKILSEPGIVHKFVKGLDERPDLRIYRKSGTWRSFHSDSALVESRDGRFILVGLSADPQGGRWLEQLAVPLYELAAAPRRRDRAAACGDASGAHRAVEPAPCATASSVKEGS
jgi:beta-lactamase class A